jgi:hypothetical protein
MSYATGHNSFTGQYLLSIYIYCRFCRLCILTCEKELNSLDCYEHLFVGQGSKEQFKIYFTNKQTNKHTHKQTKHSVVLVRLRPPLVGEVSANFC